MEYSDDVGRLVIVFQRLFPPLLLVLPAVLLPAPVLRIALFLFLFVLPGGPSPGAVVCATAGAARPFVLADAGEPASLLSGNRSVSPEVVGWVSPPLDPPCDLRDTSRPLPTPSRAPAHFRADPDCSL